MIRHVANPPAQIQRIRQHIFAIQLHHALIRL